MLLPGGDAQPLNATKAANAEMFKSFFM